MSSSASRDDGGLEDAVAVLALRARRRNRARVDELVALLGSDDGRAPDAERRGRASRLCHALAGSAGTFGDEDLADAARDLEDVLVQLSPARGDVDAAVDRLVSAAS